MINEDSDKSIEMINNTFQYDQFRFRSDVICDLNGKLRNWKKDQGFHSTDYIENGRPSRLPMTNNVYDLTLIIETKAGCICKAPSKLLQYIAIILIAGFLITVLNAIIFANQIFRK